MPSEPTELKNICRAIEELGFNGAVGPREQMGICERVVEALNRIAAALEQLVADHAPE